MSKNNNKESDVLGTELVAGHLEQALSAFKEHNKQARKGNRLAKRQYLQSVLNYEQAERQYLIEKSRMQPTFRLLVTEFLMCKPDFMNDPEQAGEAKYLSDLDVAVDARVLRIKVHVKGDAEYMRPSIVIQKSGKESVDEHAYAMTELLYFVPVDSIELSASVTSSSAYLIYRDKTTLPVIHKYGLIQQHDSALRRWDAIHLDTVYVSAHKDLSKLNSSEGCATFFRDREERVK